MERNNTFSVDLHKASKENIFYNLVMFPYPSGAGLHVGHAMNYTASDIVARFKRMQGYTVLNPIGWDSFGLPTEGYAMKVGKPASEVTKENVANFVKECELMDWSFDRSREFATSDPEYYKWTQRIFQELYKAGLVYRKEAFVNWCPKDQTVLANDQVVNGECERCGTEVVQKKHMQWFIKITDYAERLINDLDTVDRPEETKTQQKYWIGKSEGAEIDFQIVDSESKVEGNVVIIHGLYDDAKSGRKGWLHSFCDENDIKCYSPQCDQEKGLSLEKDLDILIGEVGDVINENTTIIAYSIGGITAKQLIVKLNRKIKKLVSIASSFSRPVSGEEVEDSAVISYRDQFLDHKKLEELVGEHVAYFSKDDPAIPYESAVSYFGKHYPKCRIVSLDRKGHFNEHFGVYEIPEMLSEIGLLDKKVTVFTTRPDTIYGVTAIMLAPENESIDSFLSPENKKKLEEYRKETGKKSAIERQQDGKEKSGLFSGVYATHPLTQEKVPVWFADYVLPDYATGVVMFVPAHDERDFAFAKAHEIPLQTVVAQHYISGNEPRTDKETSMRNNVLAMLYNPDMSKVLCLDRGKMNRRSFVMGGVEDGEDWATAGKREITEETGYTDIEYLKTVPGEIHAEYYASHKDINRYSKERCTIYRLKSEENTGNKEGEENHTLHWIPVTELEKYLSEVPGVNSNLIYFKRDQSENQAYTGGGRLINSQQFDGLDNQEAKVKIADYLEQQGLGRKKVTYKLRDWSISRQRYWGCPIPFYYDENGKEQLIPADELPVLLPLDVKDYKPAGKSPLADHPTFPHYTAKDGKTYLRECDTLDTFMDSAFYFLRFIDPHNDNELVSKELADKTLPVDFYMGGREHTYGHLLYSRFINKFLCDQGYISNSEPFAKLFHQGFVLAEDGRKMSKRWGNIISPGDLVEKYGEERGIDILRTYVMFMGPVEAEKSWNDNAVDGVKRFLERVERVEQFIADDGKEVDALLHKTIKGMTDDIERVKFNTAVSKLMVFVNEIYDKKVITKQQLSTFLQLLAPFATKLAQQMREKLGNEGNIHFSQRPTFNPAKIADDVINLPVQVNGKMKGTLEVPVGISQDDLVAQLKEHEKFGEQLHDKEIMKIIFVQDKIINFIVK